MYFEPETFKQTLYCIAVISMCCNIKSI